MKLSFKALSLILALLMLIACFVACGSEKQTEAESETQSSQNETETETQKLDAFGRVWVEDSVPTDVNYENTPNNTVTFFVREDDFYRTEIDVDEISDDTYRDAIYFRNKTVEDRLGVNINHVAQISGTTEAREAWFQNLRNAVNTKTGDYDCAAIYASQGSPLALEGCFYNILFMEDSIDLDKPWWNQDMNSELTIFDTLFFLGGDMMLTQTQMAAIVVYNKDIYQENYPSADIYQKVLDYKWTIDELYDLSSQVWTDANASGIVDDGDTVGFVGWNNGGQMDTWIAAMDIRIITKNSDGMPDLSFYSEHTVSAFEKLQRLHMDNPGGLNGATTNTNFPKGTVLFQTRLLRDCEAYRDMEDAYGVLPLPMYDTEQGVYATYPHASYSLLTVLSTLSEDRKDMIGQTIELMAAEAYRQVVPKYYEVCLKSKYSADVMDAHMYDLILQSIRFDMGSVYGSKSIGGVNTLFRKLDGDLTQTYEASKTKYETALETLIDKLDELSFMLGA